MVILLVEDDLKISKLIKKELELKRYTIETAYDGEEAIKKIEVNDYDLIILDLMLPKVDGIAVCEKIRELDLPVPVLMLTAKDTIGDKIKGLDIGADDYLTKPFDYQELTSRIRALLRRERLTNHPVLRVGDLVLDTNTYKVSRAGREIKLLGQEYKILDYMMRRPGRVCTRNAIIDRIWGYNFTGRHDVMESHISRLRKKIDKGRHIKLIHTIQDIGYKIEDKTESANQIINS